MADIPFGALSPQLAADEDGLRAAYERVFARGWFLNGPEASGFEEEFAAATERSWCAACANGTDALVLALAALDMPPESRVVLPSFTAPPCYHAVLAAGCIPVFAEVEEPYYTIDPQSARRMAEATGARAILAVHLYGQPCDMPALAEVCDEFGLHLVEDCAQAHGTRLDGRLAGTFGDLAAFSFYPTKNLGALGDAGAVTGERDSLDERIRLLRQYGENPRYVSVMPGMNSRMDELQAAFLRLRLTRLDELVTARRRLASLYTAGLAETPLILPVERPGAEHSYHLYVVRAGTREESSQDERARLIRHLSEKGVGTAVHYPVPGHKQPMFGLGRADVDGEMDLSFSERLANQALSLPLWPGLAEADVERVCAAIREFYGL